jgi:hypothetical protein
MTLGHNLFTAIRKKKKLSHMIYKYKNWSSVAPQPNLNEEKFTAMISKRHNLGSITNQAQMLHLAIYSQHTPSPRGGSRSNWDLFKRTVTSLYPRSREYLTGGYTFADFVTVGHMCALQRLCIHPPL